jgi:hypothetical protein
MNEGSLFEKDSAPRTAPIYSVERVQVQVDDAAADLEDAA